MCNVPGDGLPSTYPAPGWLGLGVGRIPNWIGFGGLGSHHPYCVAALVLTAALIHASQPSRPTGPIPKYCVLFATLRFAAAGAVCSQSWQAVGSIRPAV